MQQQQKYGENERNNEFVDTTNIKRLSFSQFLGTFGIQNICIANIRQLLEVDRISASVSVSAPNVDKWALSANIRFRPKAVVPHLVHFRFRRPAVGKFGGCRK